MRFTWGPLGIANCLVVSLFAPVAHSQPAPDLRVTAVDDAGAVAAFTVSLSETAPGGFVIVSDVRISNGGSAASGAFSVGLYLSADASIDASDTRFATRTYAGLGVGATRTWGPREVTIPATLAPGAYYIGVLVDDGSAVAEANETDNQVVTAQPINVRAAVNADLVPGPVVLVVGDTPYGASTTAVAAPDANVKFYSWSVINRGSEDAPPFAVSFFVSNDSQITRADARVGTRQVANGLRAGATYQTTPYPFSFSLSGFDPGTYYVGILVDPEQQVAELPASRENNNAAGGPLRVLNITSDSNPVWRAQLRLTSGGIRNAETDDYVYASLNPGNRTWLDYPRNDFEPSDVFTYDLLLGGVQRFGDIEQLQIGKEGSDGWCLYKVELLVNEIKVFEKSYAPSCRWIDPPHPNATLQFSYADLRNDAGWQAYRVIPPSVITKNSLESIVAATVGHALKDNHAYWGNSANWTGRAVEASYRSSREVHMNVEFMAYAAHDIKITTDFNLAVQCSCGNISIEVTDLTAQASSSWYPGFVKDDIEDEIESRLGGIADQLGQTIALGVPVCPIITVTTPQVDIRLDIPPAMQDLVLRSTMAYPNRGPARPGERIRVTHTVNNQGNQSSNPFSVDVYLMTGAAPTTVADVTATGVRLVTGQGQPSLAPCGDPATWAEDLTLPALACSSRASGGPRYWLAAVLQTTGEADSANDIVTSPITVSLPDVAISNLGARFRADGHVDIGPGRLANQGGLASDRLTYRVSLTAPGRSNGVRLAEGQLEALAPGATAPWRRLAVRVPANVPPGAYDILAEVLQIDGSAECNLRNNQARAPIEIP